MPRVKRRQLGMRAQLDSKRVRTYLLCGCDWQFLDGAALTSEELPQAWNVLREELMADWMTFQTIPNTWKERGEPGKRPWAWWAYDSPGRRRLLEGTERLDSPHVVISFGRPSNWWQLEATYEDEAEFLRRHGLLTAAEEYILATNPQNQF